MARARNIKPGFFKNEDLADCSLGARLCFAGLWTLADREGRLEDRPKRIKAELFPFDSFDVEPLLAELEAHGFLIRYQIEGGKFIQIPKFTTHQSPHYSEKPSSIKPPQLPEFSGKICETLLDDSEKNTPLRGVRNPLNPDSLNPDSPNVLPPVETASKPRTPRPRRELKTLAQYLEACKAEGKKPVPPEASIRGYCRDAGIADEMLQIGWIVFKDRHLNAQKDKRYKNWLQAFENSVKDRWYKLWIADGEGVKWTPTGLQEKTVIEARQAEQAARRASEQAAAEGEPA